MYVSDEKSELGQELKNGLVTGPPGFFKTSKTWRLWYNVIYKVK